MTGVDGLPAEPSTTWIGLAVDTMALLRRLDSGDVLVAIEAAVGGRAGSIDGASVPVGRVAGAVGRPLERVADRALGDLRSVASKSGASVCSDAIAESVWVRWSKTMTRSVSRNAATGAPTGSFVGSGTVGSKDDDGVVGQHADGAADEARQVRQRRDAAGAA